MTPFVIFFAILGAILLMPGVAFLAGVSLSRRITPEPFPKTGLGRLSLAAGVTLSINLLCAPNYFPVIGSLIKEALETRIISIENALENGNSRISSIPPTQEPGGGEAKSDSDRDSKLNEPRLENPSESQKGINRLSLQEPARVSSNLDRAKISVSGLYWRTVFYFFSTSVFGLFLGIVFSALIYPGPHPNFQRLRSFLLGTPRKRGRKKKLGLLGLAFFPIFRLREFLDRLLSKVLLRTRNVVEHEYLYRLGHLDGMGVTASVLVMDPKNPTHTLFRGVTRSYGVEKDGSGRISYIILEAVKIHAIRRIGDPDIPKSSWKRQPKENEISPVSSIQPSGSAMSNERKKARDLLTKGIRLESQGSYVRRVAGNSPLDRAASPPPSWGDESLYIPGPNILSIFLDHKKFPVMSAHHLQAARRILNEKKSKIDSDPHRL